MPLRGGSHDFVTNSDLTLQTVANLKWPTRSWAVSAAMAAQHGDSEQ